MRELEGAVKEKLSEKRFLHTMRCAALADRLAEHWGADREEAYVAAMLHDITKEESYESQLKLLENHGIILSDTQKLPQVIHAFSGALSAKLDFCVSDEVYNAIRWHTTARSGMSLLEKIIWLADICEEGRDFPRVEKIRRLMFSDLSGALVAGFDTTIKFLAEKGQKIDVNMIEARNYELELSERNRT